MSVMSMMHHICTIQENAQEAKGDYNVPQSPAWKTKYTTPCRLVPQVSNVRGMGGLVGEGSAPTRRDTVKHVARFLFPDTIEIDETDRIINVETAEGEKVDSGPFNIIMIRPVEKRSMHHIGVIAERII